MWRSDSQQANLNRLVAAAGLPSHVHSRLGSGSSSSPCTPAMQRANLPQVAQPPTQTQIIKKKHGKIQALLFCFFWGGAIVFIAFCFSDEKLSGHDMVARVRVTNPHLSCQSNSKTKW